MGRPQKHPLAIVLYDVDELWDLIRAPEDRLGHVRSHYPGCAQSEPHPGDHLNAPCYAVDLFLLERVINPGKPAVLSVLSMPFDPSLTRMPAIA